MRARKVFSLLTRIFFLDFLPITKLVLTVWSFTEAYGDFACRRETDFPSQHLMLYLFNHITQPGQRNFSIDLGSAVAYRNKKYIGKKQHVSSVKPITCGSLT